MKQSAIRPATAKEAYSIGEWYGRSFEALSARERFESAKALAEGSMVIQPCPFTPPNNCNKKAGVCSIRRYQKLQESAAIGVGPIVTTCPRRFLQGGEIFRWVGEVMLGASDAIVLKEIGFLEPMGKEGAGISSDKGSFVGKIDNVLVHPTSPLLRWCALELQAVYFSGAAMFYEFEMLRSQLWEWLPFPAADRHPDWRSSGPKRFLPQLQTKVPEIRRFGKKTAVVIDEFFFFISRIEGDIRPVKRRYRMVRSRL